VVSSSLSIEVIDVSNCGTLDAVVGGGDHLITLRCAWKANKNPAQYWWVIYCVLADKRFS